MSSLHKTILFSSLFFSLISCQSSDSGTSAVDKNGNCKQETIDTYNSISSSYSFKSTSELQSSCQNYKNLIGSQTCTAVVVSTGLTKSINSSSLDAICDRKTTSIPEATTPAPTPSYPSHRQSNQSEYCSEDAISSYNKLITSMKNFLTFKSEDDLKILLSDCKTFKLATLGKSCIAQNSYYEKIVISYDKFKSACNISEPIKPTPDITNEVSELKNGVKLIVLKAAKMNLLLQKGKVVKNGKVVNLKTTDEIGTCRIEKKTPQVLFQNKQSIILTHAENVQNATIIDDSRSPFTIVCIRKDFSKGTTLRDLDNIFGDIVDFKINE